MLLCYDGAALMLLCHTRSRCNDVTCTQGHSALMSLRFYSLFILFYSILFFLFILFIIILFILFTSAYSFYSIVHSTSYSLLFIQCILFNYCQHHHVLILYSPPYCSYSFTTMLLFFIHHHVIVPPFNIDYCVCILHCSLDSPLNLSSNCG